MSNNEFKIGIIGGYVSGKATFLNALLKNPCFPMQGNRHNNTIIEISPSQDDKLSWMYFDPKTNKWKKDKESLRESKTHKKIVIRIPYLLWGNTVFYDFPQINDLADWTKSYSSEIKKMDYILCILDAEYVLLAKNLDAIKAFAKSHKGNFSVVLNKCDIIDNISDMKSRIQDLCAKEGICLSLFTISAQLELQRCLEPLKRKETFAFTSTREQVMTICDLSFADLRTMLYEIVNLSTIRYNEKEK